MRSESGKHAAADPAVARLAAVAKNSIGFIDDHDNGPESADGREDSGLLPLGVAHPLAAEIPELHDGQPAFAGEAIDEERFAHTDTTRNKNAAFDDIGFSLADEPGQLSQFLFR